MEKNFVLCTFSCGESICTCHALTNSVQKVAARNILSISITIFYGLLENGVLEDSI